MIKKLLFLFPLGILTVSALANIIMAAEVSDVGAKIHAYESKALVLQVRRDDLLTTLASKQSLQQLKVWALAQGFVPRSGVVTVEPQAQKLAFRVGN